jgi:hypothetical protein
MSPRKLTPVQVLERLLTRLEKRMEALGIGWAALVGPRWRLRTLAPAATAFLVNCRLGQIRGLVPVPSARYAHRIMKRWRVSGSKFGLCWRMEGPKTRGLSAPVVKLRIPVNTSAFRRPIKH